MSSISAVTAAEVTKMTPEQKQELDKRINEQLAKLRVSLDALHQANFGTHSLEEISQMIDAYVKLENECNYLLAQKQ